MGIITHKNNNNNPSKWTLTYLPKQIHRTNNCHFESIFDTISNIFFTSKYNKWTYFKVNTFFFQQTLYFIWENAQNFWVFRGFLSALSFFSCSLAHYSIWEKKLNRENRTYINIFNSKNHKKSIIYCSFFSLFHFFSLYCSLSLYFVFVLVYVFEKYKKYSISDSFINYRQLNQ